MISNEIQKMLNEQINAEIWSAYLYYSMSINAEKHGYRGVCNWFYVQAKEEQDHARMIQKYILAKDGMVTLMPIAEVKQVWATPTEMFKAAQLHEKTISKKIDDIMHAAQKERDYSTCSFLSWFVDEQVEEEEACNELLLRFEKASDAPCLTLKNVDQKSTIFHGNNKQRTGGIKATPNSTLPYEESFYRSRKEVNC